MSEGSGAQKRRAVSAAAAAAAVDDNARAAIVGRVMEETERRLAESGKRPKPPSVFRLYLAIVALLVGYFLFPGRLRPEPVSVGPPVDWDSGVLAPGTHAIGPNVEHLFPKLLHGVDDFVFTKSGSMYINSVEGAIWKWTGKGQPVVIAHVGNKSCVFPETGPECGRPLGMALSDDERTLFVLDQFHGLSAVSLPAGHIERLLPIGVTVQPGEPNTKFLNELVRVDDALYITEASTRWEPADEYPCALECGRHGRVLKHDITSGKTTVFAKGLAMPNGIEVSDDGQHLLVCLTPIVSIVKVRLSDGAVSDYKTSMPGMPASLTRHPSGGHVVGMGTVRTLTLDYVLERPWVRKMIYKFMPTALVPLLEKTHNLCVHMDGESGDIVDSWHDETGRVVDKVMQCTVHDGYMYFTSHSANSRLSRMRLKALNRT